MPVTTTDPLASLAALPGVAEAVDASRAAMDALLREPALRRSVVRCGRRRGCGRRGRRRSWPGPTSVGGLRRTGRRRRSGLANAALQSRVEVGALADTWKRAPLQALARLHTLASRVALPVDDLWTPARAPVSATGWSPWPTWSTSTEAPGVLVAGGRARRADVTAAFGSADVPWPAPRPASCWSPGESTPMR